MGRFKKGPCPGGNSGQIYTLRASSFILPTIRKSRRRRGTQFFRLLTKQEHKARIKREKQSCIMIFRGRSMWLCICVFCCACKIWAAACGGKSQKWSLDLTCAVSEWVHLAPCSLHPCARSLNHHVCSFFPQVEKCVCVCWAHGQMCLSLLSGCVAEIKWEKSIRAARLLCVSLMLCVNLTLSTAFFFVCTCGRYERAQRLILTIFILPAVKYELVSHSTSTTNTWTFSNVEMKSYYCIIIWSPAAVSF